MDVSLLLFLPPFSFLEINRDNLFKRKSQWCPLEHPGAVLSMPTCHAAEATLTLGSLGRGGKGWMGSCLGSCHSIEMCPPPSQGT